MIELLTVIAIIAILAAIIFPVYQNTKVTARRSGDITNMNTLRTALQLYRVDQGGYPPALLGYVTTYTPGGNDVVPANLVKSFLYPKRVVSLATFKNGANPFKDSDVTTALWPAADPRAVGTAPLGDFNGDSQVNGDDDTAGARQAFNFVDNPQPVCEGLVPCSDPQRQLRFYRVSGYDVADTRRPGIRSQVELRYALFWTGYSLVGDGTNLGSALDDPRQLGYNEPPAETVMFWHGYDRNFQDDRLQAGNQDIVVFLGGGARPFASNLMAERSWRVKP